MISGDNWEDPFGYALATTGMVSSIYFCLLTMFGSFFVQKLVLAVMADSYAEEVNIAADARKRRESVRIATMHKKTNETLSQNDKQYEAPITDAISESHFELNPAMNTIHDVQDTRIDHASGIASVPATDNNNSKFDGNPDNPIKALEILKARDNDGDRDLDLDVCDFEILSSALISSHTLISSWDLGSNF